ncbi:MAG: hypothetical protein ACJ788_00725, partial [Ktedonobacteraceae bacterium]
DWATVPDPPPPVTSNQPPVGNMPPPQGYAPQGPAWSPPPQNPPYPQQQPPPAFGQQQQGPPGSVNPFAGPTQPFPPNANAGSASKRVLGMPLSLFIILLVCLLVLIGAVGAGAYLLRRNSSGTPATTSSPTSSTTSVSSSSPTAGSTSTSVSGTPTSLAFSGGANGQMDVTTYQSCGATNNGSQYNLTLQGKISGLQYNFFIRIAPYKGPGAYTTGQVFGGLSQQPVSITANWANTGNQNGNVSVNPDNKSGTLNVDMTGATNTVHVSGNWTCP